MFITGTDSYIGAILGARLLQEGCRVRGFDSGCYRNKGWFFTEAARWAGVRRFVYTPSCSIYGVAEQKIMNESLPVNPQTTYAECKVMAEEDLGKMADEGFEPAFLRSTMVYGASPRMRFDTILNNLFGLARMTKKIAMTSDGCPWRPIVHIEDICTAIHCTPKALTENIQNQVFNVGANSENYRIREVAEIIKEAFPDREITLEPSGGDNRSYRISFDKIYARLPGFACKWSACDGARQLRDLFECIDTNGDIFNLRPYTRLKCLKYLLQTGQMDKVITG